MTDIHVLPVTTRTQRKQFLRLPWSLYADDPYWIPPLLMQQKEMLGFARHPFYDRAEGQAFLAIKDGRPCGRVHAIINRAHNERYHERRGFFGFFECIDDQEVANELFDAAIEWLAEREMESVRGPTNPSLNYECGLLIDGFDDPPFFMMTYNHPYYDRLIASYGFQKTQDLYAYWGNLDIHEKLDPKLLTLVAEVSKRMNITFRYMDKSRFKSEVRAFLDIYNRSLESTWGFVPLSPEEVDHMAAGLKYLIEPKLCAVAEVQGQPIGSVFGLLDYNPRIKEINGRLFPFGFIRLLSSKRKIHRCRLISTNVVPQYQRWGVGLALLHHLYPEAAGWGIREAEFSWILESNRLSWGTLDRAGAKRMKTYRLYDLDFKKGERKA